MKPLVIILIVNREQTISLCNIEYPIKRIVWYLLLYEKYERYIETIKQKKCPTNFRKFQMIEGLGIGHLMCRLSPFLFILKLIEWIGNRWKLPQPKQTFQWHSQGQAKN